MLRSRLFLGVAVLLSLSGCADDMEVPFEDESLIGGGVQEQEPGTSEQAVTGCLTVGSTLITNDDLNLRSGPGTTNSILLTMPLGSRVTVQQSCPTNGFYNVRYGTTNGWSSGTYLNTFRSVTVTGGFTVRSHVQSYANAVCSATGACAISTYSTHHPTADRAVDILASSRYGVLPSDNYALGDKVSRMTLNQWSSYRTWYVIWRQRINYNDGRGWIGMEDRGSITQNHYDHVHTSFYE
jgi:uncharacterized protein YraI